MPMRVYFDNFDINAHSPQRKRAVSPPVGYLLPSTLSSKTCTFGIGDRFKERSTSPGRFTDQMYDLPTVFKPDNTTSTFCNFMVGSRTFCFGTGRDEMKG